MGQFQKGLELIEGKGEDKERDNSRNKEKPNEDTIENYREILGSPITLGEFGRTKETNVEVFEETIEDVLRRLGKELPQVQGNKKKMEEKEELSNKIETNKGKQKKKNKTNKRANKGKVEILDSNQMKQRKLDKESRNYLVNGRPEEETKLINLINLEDYHKYLPAKFLANSKVYTIRFEAFKSNSNYDSPENKYQFRITTRETNGETKDFQEGEIKKENMVNITEEGQVFEEESRKTSEDKVKDILSNIEEPFIFTKECTAIVIVDILEILLKLNSNEIERVTSEPMGNYNIYDNIERIRTYSKTRDINDLERKPINYNLPKLENKSGKTNTK